MDIINLSIEFKKLILNEKKIFFKNNGQNRNSSKNIINYRLNTPVSKNSNLNKKTLKISVDLYMKNDISMSKIKPISYLKIFKNSNNKKPSISENNDKILYNTHKRNSNSKSSHYLENVVSPSRSSFLNNSKIPSNHNNMVQINLNSINSEFNLLNEKIKKTESNKVHESSNKNKNSKLKFIQKYDKKNRINTLSNEKYYENVKNLFKGMFNSKKNNKKNNMNKKMTEAKINKHIHVQTLNNLTSIKNLKNEVKENKDKSSVSLNTSFQNLNIPMSPKVNITINSNVASPKVPNKSLSSLKKSNNVVNTSINSGVSPKSTIILDNLPIKLIDKSHVLENFKLSLGEMEEINSVNEVYYIGKIKRRVKIKSARSNENKSYYNWDDEDGYYTIIKGDHLLYRYEIISELGRGSYGQGVKCFDHKVNEFVCVKIIRNKKKFNKQALIETRILNYLNENDKHNEYNNVKMIDNFVFRNHICIVFELLDISLYDYLRNQDFKGMNLSDVRHIAYQILKSLEFLRKHSIVHCDLKPENILLKKKLNRKDIKVIDFGSACFENEKLYSYIQSRFYRAPEVILGLGYSPNIDIWSFGCIISEIYNGIPIFPGETESDQLYLIIEYLGLPPPEMINNSKNKNQYFDEDNKFIRYTTSKKSEGINLKKIEKFLDYSNEKFIDLVKKCLTWDPEKRIKPEEALKHPFFVKKKDKGLTINTNIKLRKKDCKSYNDIKNKFNTPNNKINRISSTKNGLNT